MKDKHLEAFGATIRRKREELGISQEDFADLSGLHRTYVGGVERGERNVGLLSVIRIANGLKIPVSILLQGLDEVSNQ